MIKEKNNRKKKKILFVILVLLIFLITFISTVVYLKKVKETDKLEFEENSKTTSNIAETEEVISEEEINNAIELANTERNDQLIEKTKEIYHATKKENSSINKIEDAKDLPSETEEDKEPPIITGIENNTWYSDTVTIKISDKSSYTAKLIDENGKETKYKSGTEITKEGIYTLEVIDVVGNRTIYTFGIDKSKPEISNILKINNTDVIPEVKDLSTVIAVLNGELYKIGTPITEDGDYRLLVVDAAGNASAVEFTIDKTVPTVTITKSNEDKPTNQNVTATLIADEKIKTPEEWEKVDDVTFTKTYSNNGTYNVIIEDLAGNKTEIEIVIKNIDRTVPKITIKPSPYSIGSENRYSQISFSLYDYGRNMDKAIINNVHELNRSSSSEYADLNYINIKGYLREGENSVYIVDKAGNVSQTIVFILDRIKPKGTIEVSDNDLSVTLTTDEEIKTPEGWEKIDDVTFTKTYQSDGAYSVTIEDFAGNKTEIEFDVKSYNQYDYIELTQENNKFIINTNSLSYKNKIELKVNILQTKYHDLLLIYGNDGNLAYKIRQESTYLHIHRTSNYGATLIDKNNFSTNKVMTITQTDSKSTYQYEGEEVKTPITGWENWTNSRFYSTDGKVYLGHIKSRIYYLKIYDTNGEIMNELIPVKKKEDGKSYLYDKITNQYYSCSGAVAKNN